MSSPRAARRPDLLMREGFILAAYVAALVGVQKYVTGALICVAAVLTVERVVRRPGRERVAAVSIGIVGFAASLVALVLILDAAPRGTSRVLWSTVATAIALAVLASCLRAPAPAPVRLPGVRHVNALGWYAVAAALGAIPVFITMHVTSRVAAPHSVVVQIPLDDTLSSEVPGFPVPESPVPEPPVPSSPEPVPTASIPSTIPPVPTPVLGPASPLPTAALQLAARS